jgi:hypothetical protein
VTRSALTETGNIGSVLLSSDDLARPRVAHDAGFREKYLSRYGRLHFAFRAVVDICVDFPKLADRQRIASPTFGLAMLFMQSIHEDAGAVLALLPNGRVRVAGAVAAAAWEKALTLEYVLLDPAARTEAYAQMAPFLKRKGSWLIEDLIKEVSAAKNDGWDADRRANEADWYRLMYATLCALKHPNPRSVVYLQSLANGHWDHSTIEEAEQVLFGLSILVISYFYSVLHDALDRLVTLFGNSSSRANIEPVVGEMNDALMATIGDDGFKFPDFGVPHKTESKERFIEFLSTRGQAKHVDSLEDR